MQTKPKIKPVCNVFYKINTYIPGAIRTAFTVKSRNKYTINKFKADECFLI